MRDRKNTRGPQVFIYVARGSFRNDCFNSESGSNSGAPGVRKREVLLFFRRLPSVAVTAVTDGQGKSPRMTENRDIPSGFMRTIFFMCHENVFLN